MDRKRAIDAKYLNFRKAFDSYDILVSKLRKYKLDETTLKAHYWWITRLRKSTYQLLNV